MNQMIGLFPLKLRSVGMPGSPVLTLELLVCPPEHRVSGLATITQAIFPPLNIKYHVGGKYSTMTVMPPVTHYQIKLEGAHFNPADVALHEDPKENNGIFNAMIVLDDTWSRGEVIYSYEGQKPIHQPIEAVTPFVETGSKAA